MMEDSVAQATARLTWTAWRSGKVKPSGSGYGLKVPIADRTDHFKKEWPTVFLEIPNGHGFDDIEVNTNKPSFWNDTCRELISQHIGRWLWRCNLADWPKGKPPKIQVGVIAERRFRLLEPRST